MSNLTQGVWHIFTLHLFLVMVVEVYSIENPLYKINPASDEILFHRTFHHSGRISLRTEGCLLVQIVKVLNVESLRLVKPKVVSQFDALVAPRLQWQQWRPIIHFFIFSYWRRKTRSPKTSDCSRGNSLMYHKGHLVSFKRFISVDFF